MVVKNIIAEDMPFTKSIFEQFWRSYCKKTIFVVFHFLKFLPNCNSVNHTHLVFRSLKAATEAWIALEDESEEEEIDGEDEEKEEETDVETDGEAVEEVFELF